jgi:hypothetical protein
MLGGEEMASRSEQLEEVVLAAERAARFYVLLA